SADFLRICRSTPTPESYSFRTRPRIVAAGSHSKRPIRRQAMDTRDTPAAPTAGWRAVVWGSRLALVSPLFWPPLWKHLFDSGYMPHGQCYLWLRSLVALHLVSDLVIGLSYVAISASLIYLVHRARRDLPFHWLILSFGAFIVACGATHFMEVWTIWHATYWLSGAIKVVTAIASVVTAFALPVVIPGVLRLMTDARVSRERQQNVEIAHHDLEAAYEQIRETDEVLRREHRYMSALLSGLQEQVIVCDADGRVIFSNGRDAAGRQRHSVTAMEVFNEVEMLDAETGQPLPRRERAPARSPGGGAGGGAE